MAAIYFDILHLYYLPQFLPVARKLRAAKCDLLFVVHNEPQTASVTHKALNDEGFSFQVVENADQAKALYLDKKPNWVIFGNAPCSSYTELQSEGLKLAYMQHGIGPKACYYVTSEFPFDVRFVEGPKRLQRLSEMFPNRRFEDVGYAKLDPLFCEGDSELVSLANAVDLASLGLDPKKSTILYAPTFFPSSIECFSDDWPSEMSAYNIIIKPHFFSYTKKKYHKQRDKLDAWATHSNVYMGPIDCYSLLPFMGLADIMLSEASSTVFEFAALDKPVVWCDFYKVRWTYRGIFKSRLTKRMDPDMSIFHDICERATDPKQVAQLVAQSLASPSIKSAQRKAVTLDMAGKTDGKCSSRIRDYLLVNLG
ncbi:CDP-glycerol glycerophosphotransferase family protein [Glaciecola sp. MH2013]|uniref:CDP-glycerol glycerophosphotransferase family protein n=1 Tax=Glaciecola sp. MH2013 TaxID=2785524 RepID=UPI00189F8C35|nr:CDP-glycerol glycerophosphotransferase family protein [Glaciecola sp. MH2013]MBF7073351.1 CDP-glycerol glycerophosphotransferase family protein [Glaciecola sp. MH2013]